VDPNARSAEAFVALYTAEEMKAAEAGHDVEQLMQRAGNALAEYVLEYFGDHERITAVCGGGNNGGDARIAADALQRSGKDLRLVDVQPEEEVKDLGSPDLVLDGIFGTGFQGEPRPGTARLIERINELDVEVIAVDVPSGVDASTGEVAGAAVDAWCTFSFHGEKVGSRVSPGSFHSGWTAVADIGLEARETSHAHVTSAILDLVPLRGANRPETKYTAGSVLVVGGSPGLTGAACLAAEAAFRADAGYVAVAAPAESLPIIEQRLLEAVKRRLEEVWEAAERASALAIGPGLGRSHEAKALVRRLLEETDLPAVVDADALHELEPFRRDAPTVLTPHSGELSNLLDVESSWVDAHRLAAARQAGERFGCVVLLKGDETIVAAPGEQTLISTGSASLATAGTGDVLTGVIGAFLAKGLDARVAAAAGARAHADAALSAGHFAGLIASDVIAALPGVLDAAV
jgi:ADP-dependent NAD(P)H-hydrate dehydratase / NAD(P)H-hydrate epimerase